MTAALVSAVETLMAGVLAKRPDLPGVACAIEAPRLGLSWTGGVDGPLAGDRDDPPGERPFRTASITKPFTAATVHRLAAEGRLSLEDPVSERASGETCRLLVEGGYDPDAIRVRHLLSHTSGLFDHTETASYLPAVFSSPRRRWLRGEQVEAAMREGRPWGAPGEVYRYSDTGYIVLGEIVERASGLPLAAAARERLGFERLGLTRTWWEDAEPAPADAPALARQYAGTTLASEIDASFDLYGGGGLVSTTGDLARFMGALPIGAVLAPGTLAGALATPAAPPPAGGPPAWRTHSHLLASMPIGGRWALGHTGAWASIMLYFADHDAAVAVTLNREGAEAMAAMRDFAGDLATLLDRAIPSMGG